MVQFCGFILAPVSHRPLPCILDPLKKQVLSWLLRNNLVSITFSEIQTRARPFSEGRVFSFALSLGEFTFVEVKRRCLLLGSFLSLALAGFHTVCGGGMCQTFS